MQEAEDSEGTEETEVRGWDVSGDWGKRLQDQGGSYTRKSRVGSQETQEPMSMIRDTKGLEDCVGGIGPRQHRRAQATMVKRPCIDKPDEQQILSYM